MYASSYYTNNIDNIQDVVPQRIDVDLVLYFYSFPDSKLKSSTDELLLLKIIFIKVVSKYNMFP